MARGGRLARVDVADDDDVEVELLLAPVGGWGELVGKRRRKKGEKKVREMRRRRKKKRRLRGVRLPSSREAKREFSTAALSTRFAIALLPRRLAKPSSFDSPALEHRPLAGVHLPDPSPQTRRWTGTDPPAGRAGRPDDQEQARERGERSCCSTLSGTRSPRR